MRFRSKRKEIAKRQQPEPVEWVTHDSVTNQSPTAFRRLQISLPRRPRTSFKSREAEKVPLDFFSRSNDSLESTLVRFEIENLFLRGSRADLLHPHFKVLREFWWYCSVRVGAPHLISAGLVPGRDGQLVCYLVHSQEFRPPVTDRRKAIRHGWAKRSCSQPV